MNMSQGRNFLTSLRACARLSRRTSWRAHYVDSTIARVLHLADRQDVTTNGKEITTATQPISVVLDPEAAKIIQSIGRRTVKE